jgi:thioredoxin-dependent peroxiredoxin
MGEIEMRLLEGDSAIDFTIKDLAGNDVKLSDYKGQKIMLSFYRYASCPLCNLRVHNLIEHYSKWKENGVVMLGVFQSPPETMKEYLGKQDVPFTLMGDPQHILYGMYGVEAKWSSFFKAFITRGIDTVKAMCKGYMPGKMDGNKHQVPADFLINEDFTIKTAYYGKDIGDHLPIKEIELWVNP